MSNFKTIYIRKGKEETYKNLKKALEREGKSLGDFLIDSAEVFLRGHGDGNSQTLMDYAGLPKTLPRYQTCISAKHRGDGRVDLVKGEFYCGLRHLESWKIPDACTQCRSYREVKT